MINLKKIFTVGEIIAGIIGAGFAIGKGIAELHEETQPELPGPTDEES